MAATELQYLRFHPPAPQGPINKTIGAYRPQPGTTATSLVAQYQVMPRINAPREDRFRQSVIAKRQRTLKEVTSPDAEEPNTKGTTNIGYANKFGTFSGIARDASVQMAASTAPYLTVASRGLTPVAVPRPIPNETTHQLWPAGRLGTAVMELTPGIASITTVDTYDPNFTHTNRVDLVGTVLHHNTGEHPLVHLHPISHESLAALKRAYRTGAPTEGADASLLGDFDYGEDASEGERNLFAGGFSKSGKQPSGTFVAGFAKVAVPAPVEQPPAPEKAPAAPPSGKKGKRKKASKSTSAP